MSYTANDETVARRLLVQQRLRDAVVTAFAEFGVEETLAVVRRFGSGMNVPKRAERRHKVWMHR